MRSKDVGQAISWWKDRDEDRITTGRLESLYTIINRSVSQHTWAWMQNTSHCY